MTISSQKVGRNDPCPCGSGKKYKKCCAQKQASTSPAASKIDLSAATREAFQLYQSGHFNKAYTACNNIINADPANLIAIQIITKLLLQQNHYEAAVSIVENAIKIKPKQAEFFSLLGNIRKSQHLIDDGIRLLSKAIELNPDFADAYLNRANALGLQGKIDEAIADYRKALSLDSGFDAAFMNYLFMLNFSTNISESEIAKEHFRFGESVEIRYIHEIQKSSGYNYGHERLRIAYISADFYDHSVAYYIGPVLANHDHDSFEIYGYYSNSIQDQITKKLQNYCDEWRNIESLSDESVVDLIRKDEIDILIDLSGYTANSRLLVFAQKPAPAQVAWIGYPNTTGLSCMDFRITDSIADPPGSDDFYTEELYRLSDGFSVYQAPEQCPDVSELPYMKNEYVTFGSFNNFSKTNDVVIQLWSRLLLEITGAKLLLKNPALSDESMKDKVKAAFQKNGVSSDRLILYGMDRDKMVHFQRYNEVDIGLDPFPYNGTTTTCEALWMGVPVVTLRGDSHRARVGASLLSNLCHEEWIASSHDDYISKATDLAKNITELKDVRMGLRDEMRSSPLTDAATFTSKVEDAYKDIWLNKTS